MGRLNLKPALPVASVSRSTYFATSALMAMIASAAITHVFVPNAAQDVAQQLTIILSIFAGLFGMLALVPLALTERSAQPGTQSILNIVNELLNTKGQQVIMMLPVTSSGHLNASLHLGGMLTQFGRDAIVLDVDLSHRMLSRKIPTMHPTGVMAHLLEPDLKKPYLDSLSGARVIPLESTLDADKVVEYSQVVQRIPKLWERWPGSVVLLDLSQWHESYHLFLPTVSQVIFYVPPGYKASTLLPKVFKGKYKVPVSIVEIQPDL